MNPLNLIPPQALPFVLLGAFMAGGVLGWHEKALRFPAALEAQQKADAKACDFSKLITRSANDAIQNDNAATFGLLDSLLLQHPAACLPVASSPKFPAARPGSPAGDGINTRTLREYAAKSCKVYWSELKTCIKFIHDEREPQK